MIRSARSLTLALLAAAAAGLVAQEAPAPPAPVNLPTPFTAEQIRDEWVAGLTLEMLRKTPEGEQLQRWTVKSADLEGADIEFAVLGADGTVAGEPRIGLAYIGAHPQCFQSPCRRQNPFARDLVPVVQFHATESTGWPPRRR